ncbi:MAG: hypothetical protein RRY23_00125 [Alistipes sp.]
MVESSCIAGVGVNILLDDFRVSVVGFLCSGAKTSMPDLDDAFAFLRSFIVGHEGESKRYIPLGEISHLSYCFE